MGKLPTEKITRRMRRPELATKRYAVAEAYDERGGKTLKEIAEDFGYKSLQSIYNCVDWVNAQLDEGNK